MGLSGSADTTLAELELRDGVTITMITDSARDYSRCREPENVVKTGSYPNGIAIDECGRLYVSHFGGELQVLDPSLKQTLHKTTVPTAPRQMALTPSGDLLLAFDDGVRLFNSTLEPIRHLRGFSCTGVALHGEIIYASDSSKNVIHKVQLSDGKLLSEHSPGLRSPQAMCVFDDRLLVVADRGNDRIVFLDLETLEVASQLPRLGCTNKKACLSHPNDVIVDAGGNLLVMDTGNARIAVFREDGELVTSALEGFFKDHGNTFSYLFYHPVTGAIAVSNNDEHCITTFAPIFKTSAPSG